MAYIINIFGKVERWALVKRQIPDRIFREALLNVPPWESPSPQRIYDECVEIRQRELNATEEEPE